jgi:hypothetical protein
MSTKTVANLLEDFDISLTEDELIARGVPEATVERLVTSSAANLGTYLKEKNWSIEVFYTAVAARELLRSKRKEERSAPAPTKVHVRKRIQRFKEEADE